MTKPQDRVKRVDDALAKQLQNSIEANAKLVQQNARLLQKAKEMRNAIDGIESALMGFDNLVDLPEKWGEPRFGSHVKATIVATAGEVYRVTDALAECTRIINSAEYAVEALGKRNEEG